MDKTASRAGTEDEVSVAEARHDLARWVHQAESGRAVKITRRGKPVAVLVPLATFEAQQAAQPRKGFGDFMLSWRERTGGVDLTDAEIDSWRDRSPGRPSPWADEE